MLKNFSDLQGQTLKHVQNVGDEMILFVLEDGSKYGLMHFQDCCENVRVESVVGDLQDLVGTPILLAEEATGDTPADYQKQNEWDLCESYTWTFYKLRTIKGSVDIRFLGESNGYYSESVYFEPIAGDNV